MSDIFKIIYLDHTNNKNMIVFFGEKGGTNVNKLFTEDKGNDLFEGLFSKDQMDMIIKDNIDVTF